MFKTFGGSGNETKELNHSGRSHVGETMQLEGDLRSSGSIDVAGLVNGNVFVSEITITETGSVRGAIEAVIVGKNAVIKGDIFFKNTLKTEEGADIDGYIKRVNTGKTSTDEDIAIEEIVERDKSVKPKVVPVTQHKEAV